MKLAFILLSTVAAAVRPATALPAQENVLLIVADDIGVDVLSCYGEGSIVPPTPNLDALAAQGLLFRNAWGNPTCSPTRATILSGRYGFRTGVGNTVRTNINGLPLSELTIPECLDLGGLGYRCAAFGKWHLGNNSNGAYAAPNLAGFSHYSGAILNFSAPSTYDSWPETVDGTTIKTLRYATTENVDDALAWIGQQSGPWLCYLAFNAAHAPLHAPPQALHGFDLTGLDPFVTPLPFFHAMIEAMDREIGRLLGALDLERTTVIFIGDNGTLEALVQPPFDPDHGKATLYEGGINVPLIVRSSAVVQPGREVGALVNACDLFATVLELADLDPASVLPPGTQLDSVSLLPYLRHPHQAPLRETVFSELFSGMRVPNTREGKAIRNSRYKLIRFTYYPEEFYDLEADPFEQDDLLLHAALDPEQQANLDELRVRLEVLLGG
ncbi:MAG: hypothetical protein EYC70_09560 [Planctomycetota bacterium]|nr:MAG: hypothetical protein EYC70_09560 [Planctomycetota bacterium]